MGRHNSACVVTAQGDFIKQPPHWWRGWGLVHTRVFTSLCELLIAVQWIFVFSWVFMSVFMAICTMPCHGVLVLILNHTPSFY